MSKSFKSNELLAPFGLRLVDRADGAKGHFAIQRNIPGHNHKYVEHWNEDCHGWNSFGTCYHSELEALQHAWGLCLALPAAEKPETPAAAKPDRPSPTHQLFEADAKSCRIRPGSVVFQKTAKHTWPLPYVKDPTMLFLSIEVSVISHGSPSLLLLRAPGFGDPENPGDGFLLACIEDVIYEAPKEHETVEESGGLLERLAALDNENQHLKHQLAGYRANIRSEYDKPHAPGSPRDASWSEGWQLAQLDLRTGVQKAWDNSMPDGPA